jgi:probable RNA-binding protein EIF1AD
MRHPATQRSLQEFIEIQPSQCICKIIETRGGGLFSVSSENEAIQLVSLPSRFQKLIWVKRGSFVVVEPDPLSRTKVNGEIVNILFAKDIHELKRNQQWPALFSDIPELNASSEEDQEEDDDDLFVNTNRHYEDSD